MASTESREAHTRALGMVKPSGGREGGDAQTWSPDGRDFNGWSRRYGIDGEKVAVREEVELMNSLGMMFPHTYLCIYENGTATLISLIPG